MCFGGSSSAPTAPTTTPAVPVDQITAGHPTITVAPNPSTNQPDAAPRTAATPASQSPGSTGLNM